MTDTHWQYPFEFDINDYVGFVYKITLSDGRFYIGRKNFFSKKTLKPLKGKKRSRIVYKESDWKTYQSSSPILKTILEAPAAPVEATMIEGDQEVEPTTFKILKLCTTKSEMSYYEVYFIVVTGALIDPNGLNHNASRIPCRPKLTTS